MAYSEYLGSAPILICDDDGAYYLRQLDSRDDVDFEGLVWFGQFLDREPIWANVFVGRLRRGVREDERGEPVDEWEGAFFDVPKGMICGHGPITLESLIIPPNPRISICSFPENYLRRTAGTGFGGRTWGIQGLISGCWDDGPELPPRPALPPIFAEAIREDSRGTDRLVAGLGSGSLASGFSQSGNLTGTWIGDDGGSYYLRHIPESGDVVWYGESSAATPPIRSGGEFHPARGFANVFVGKLVGDEIEGFWADVPRGATRGSGQMTVRRNGNQFLEITSVTGGFGGRRLWRVESLEVTVRVPRLTILEAGEGRDEPLLYLSFFKIDGDTVDLDDLALSRASFFHPPSTLVGRDLTGTVSVDPRISTFQTTVRTVRSRSGRDVEAATRIGVVAHAFEADDGYSEDFLHTRLMTWQASQEGFVNRELAAGRIPDGGSVRTNAQRILTRYLGPWEGWPFGDPDDPLSGDATLVAFAELSAAANGTGEEIRRQLTFTGSGARYGADVVITVRSRLNPDCSG